MNKMINELFAKCVRVSEKTNADVFCAYSPHVAWIDVDIHTNGWHEGTPADAQFRLRLHNGYGWMRDYADCMTALDELEHANE